MATDFDKKIISGLSEADQTRLNQLWKISRWLDFAYRIPFLKRYRIGYDGILGLLPIAGDTIALGVALYWYYSAFRLQIPIKIRLILLGRIALDYLVGLLPILGDFIDVGYQANRKNYLTVVKYLENH